MSACTSAPCPDSAPPLHPLLAWLQTLSGHVHHSLQIACTSSRGYHLVSTGPIPANSTLVTTPFAATLSVLSIPLAASHWPLSFLDAWAAAPEVLARFLLVEVKLQGGQSAWWEYVRMLPGVEDVPGFETPLFWDEGDLRWLKGTNLHGAAEGREKAWRGEWDRGVEMLRGEKVGVDGYSWELYKWAATVLTSRCFHQDVLKGSGPGSWSTVDEENIFAQCEIARRWREGDDSLVFPVLLPVLDLANHDPDVKTTWLSDDGRCSFIRHEGIGSGQEVCNNYGKKGNEEFIMGYGFLLEDNAADFVVLATSKAERPPEDITGGNARTETDLAAKLYMPSADSRPSWIVLDALSHGDACKLVGQVANTREGTYLTEDPATSRFSLDDTRLESLMIDRLILSLEDRRARLEASAPSQTPANDRQRLATRYRDSQISILSANSELLDEHLRSLQSKGFIMTLGKLLSDAPRSAHGRSLLSLIEAYGVRPKAKIIRAQGLHEFVFTVWICYAWLIGHSAGSLDDHEQLRWVRFIESVYCAPPGWDHGTCHNLDCHLRDDWGLRSRPESPLSNAEDLEADQVVASYLALLQQQMPEDAGSLFADPRWTGPFLRWGLNIWREESVVFESLGRLVMNGPDEEHEDMLFLVRP